MPWLADQAAAEYSAVSAFEAALYARAQLSQKTEGIIPGAESATAIDGIIERMQNEPR